MGTRLGGCAEALDRAAFSRITCIILKTAVKNLENLATIWNKR